MLRLPLSATAALLAGAVLAGTEVREMSGERVDCPSAAVYFAPQYGETDAFTVKRTLAAEGKDAVARFVFTPKAEMRTGELRVVATLARGEYGGGKAVADGKATDIPTAPRKGAKVVEGRFVSFKLADRFGKERLNLAFARPTQIRLADDGFWNEDAFRVTISAGDWNAKTAAGATAEIAVRFTDPAGVTVGGDATVAIKAGPDWIPVRLCRSIADGSAIDFSEICGERHPAGAYGYVVARGDHFEFERLPGVPQRIYGVNFCGDANAPDAESAERTAANLRKMGYNAIRVHHHESTLADRGKGRVGLDPKAMERFDRFIACCITNGIYVTTDLFVSRHGVRYRDCGIDRDGAIEMQAYKDLVMTNPGVYRNYLDWSRSFLGHVNPFTGRRYADEPALSFISLVNEGHPGGMQLPRETGDLQRRWKEWRAKASAADPAAYKDVPQDLPPGPWGDSAGAAAFATFVRDLEADFFRRVRTFLREEMKCRALLTNLNDGLFTLGGQLTRAEEYDYVDEHFYVDHPRFVEKQWRLPSRCPNANPFMNPALGSLEDVSVRMADRPFTITEYNYSGPGRFRGVGGIVCGTMAALQDWSGLWRFTWTHSKDDLANPEKATLGYFNVAGDPLSCAAERASICLFLRRDIQPLSRRLAIAYSRDELRLPIADSALRDRAFASRWVAWYARIGGVIGARPGWADWCVTGLGGYHLASEEMRKLVFPGLAADDPLPRAGEGAIGIDSERGSFVIDTPRTAGGFAESGTLEAGTVGLDIAGAPATVWASSVDGRDIADSRRLLVTHLTDVQNTDMTYGDSHLRLTLGWGHGPLLMRRGTARVSLAVGDGDWQVWALGSDGARRRPVAAEIRDGRLTFTADTAADPREATSLYEVTRPATFWERLFGG